MMIKSVYLFSNKIKQTRQFVWKSSFELVTQSTIWIWRKSSHCLMQHCCMSWPSDFNTLIKHSFNLSEIELLNWWGHPVLWCWMWLCKLNWWLLQVQVFSIVAHPVGGLEERKFYSTYCKTWQCSYTVGGLSQIQCKSFFVSRTSLPHMPSTLNQRWYQECKQYRPQQEIKVPCCLHLLMWVACNWNCLIILALIMLFT